MSEIASSHLRIIGHHANKRNVMPSMQLLQDVKRAQISTSR
jgi:hypothetical protein